MAKILIVDDDEDIVEAMRTVLTSEGFDVLVAHGRKSGLELVQSERPDLLILDVMMEESDDGIAMAQDLRRQGVSTPILMLTSFSGVTGIRIETGSNVVPVDLFFEKPVAPKKLVEAVRALLSRGRV